MSESATSSIKTILIADDDHNSASFLVWAVRSLGYNPIWVTDGQVAFRKAKELLPVAILMDIMMPGFDGMMGIRLLRMNESTRAIPIIVVSGLTGQNDAAVCRSEGANDFLSKPFTMDKLREVLGQYAPVAPKSR